MFSRLAIFKTFMLDIAFANWIMEESYMLT